MSTEQKMMMAPPRITTLSVNLLVIMKPVPKLKFFRIVEGRRPTVWLSGGRRGGTCGAEQLCFRAACFRAAHAARPLEPVLGGSWCARAFSSMGSMLAVLQSIRDSEECVAVNESLDLQPILM